MHTSDHEPMTGGLGHWQRSAATFDFARTNGDVLRIDVLTAALLRIRYAAGGRFGESLNARYGYVREHWAPVPVSVQEDGAAIHLVTESWTIRVDRRTLQVSCLNNDGEGSGGEVITGQATPLSSVPGQKPVIRHVLPEDEHVYGFGFQRLALDGRGQKLLWARRFRHQGATAPFFVSSRGYGLFSNNTWEQTFDFSDTAAGVYSIVADGGEIDYYLIYGPSLRQVLYRYTELTGRPILPPRWATGLLYICRYLETQNAVIEIADRFRSEDIPCDMIGLEPGWEDEPYRMGWRWSKERFPDPAGLVSELSRRGYALEMWESGDAPKTDYADPQVRRAWYQKRVAGSLALGVRFFKQDDPYPRGIISEELQAPQLGEPLGGSGDLCKEEMYNLSNTLYSETAMLEYRHLTAKRTFFIFNGYNSSVASHRWPVAWAADFAAGCGMLSASLSGHGMVSFDMRNQTPAGIHHGFLVPFSIIDAWAYYREPWLWPDYLQDCHRLYAKLRHCLAPYLYSSLWQANQTGLPVLRPMVLDYTHDTEARGLEKQYMLGDWLLCGLEERLYLPAGEWIDYWSGKRYLSAGQWINCPVVEPAGGPLLIKAGAIIPMKTISSFIEGEPAELLLLNVYPAGERSTYTIYEDDGESYAYESGAHVTTECACQAVADQVRLTIGPRRGDHAGGPAARTYLVCLHLQAAPLEVRLGDLALAEEFGGRDALLRDSIARGWSYHADEGLLWIKPDSGWRMGTDQRGAGDPEQDTLIWTDRQRPSGGEYEIAVKLSPGANPLTTEKQELASRTPRPYPLSPLPQPPVLLQPDRLFVVANPPERIPLKWGDWLAYHTNLYVSIRAGEQTVTTAVNVVRMEVVDEDGTIIHSEEKSAQRGRVEFLNVDYKPAEWTFRFSSDGLQPCQVIIRPAPFVPGTAYGPDPG